MVTTEEINNIFTNIINSYKDLDLTVKCESRKTIQSKLDKMSEEEKYDALGELLSEGIISDYEAEYYDSVIDKYNSVKDKDISNFPQRVQDEVEAMGEAIYQIESKIITKKATELSSFNEDDFEIDPTPYNSDEIGDLEARNLEQQNKNLADIDWDFYGDGTNFYSDYHYYDVNKTLTMGDAYWKELIKENPSKKEDLEYTQKYTNDIINHLHYLMDKGGGLTQDTVLYRGGIFPSNILPGMKGKFDTIASTSYNKEKAEGFQQEGKEYLMTIYAPKGTKGLGGSGKYRNDDDMHLGVLHEHEFTLRDGQKYIVLDKNDRDKTVSILLI